LPPVPDVPGAVLMRGAFVTITARGALRGCIGHIADERPLGEVVREMTVAAARDDPRFAAVEPDELPDVSLEISVLTPAAPFRATPVDPERVVVGRDGLIVRRGSHVGLLLPQVATQYQWEPAAFLAATCRKAGLPPEAWLQRGSASDYSLSVRALAYIAAGHVIHHADPEGAIPVRTAWRS